MRTRSICIVLALAQSGLTGCATQSAVETQVGLPLQMKKTINFVDLDSFDVLLERSLESGANEIEINFIAPMSPNQISPRLGKWLNTVQEIGGTVEVKSENRTRGPSILVSLVSSLYDAWKGMKQRNLVKGMDAELVLSQSELKRVTFKRRAEGIK